MYIYVDENHSNILSFYSNMGKKSLWTYMILLENYKMIL